MGIRDLAADATENFRTHAIFPSRGVREALLNESPELTWVDSGLETDTFNIVLGSRLREDRVRETVAAITAHFAQARRPFSWWICPGDSPVDLADRLVEAGLVSEEWELAMGCDLARTPDEPRTVAGLAIERARTPEELADFARINAENWDPPDPLVERYYGRAVERLLAADSPLRFYLARVGGRAVAAVEIAVGGGVLGVYNLSTRSEYRGRGSGGALLSTALQDGRRATGAREAVLQAAPAAAGLYRRLGFEEFGRIAEFKPIRSVR